MDECIEQLKKLKELKHSAIEFIQNYPALIKNLEELNSLIGMNKFKEEISNLIKFIVVNSYNRTFGSNGNNKNLLDNHMINMILAGSPGCGKTTVAHYIAKVIASMGILKQPKANEMFPNPITPFISKEITNMVKAHNKQLLTERRKHNKVLDSVSKVCEDLKDLADELQGGSLCPQKTYRVRKMESELRVHCVDKIEPFTPEKDVPFFVYNRANLVAEYLGQTAPKTLSALKKALGGVVLIDEAYSLFPEEREDMFGAECLTTINEFMSQNSESIVIIFAGYTDKLEKTIFRAQPGLKRRIGWIFEIDSYSGDDLYKIFEQQISRFDGWSLDKDDRIKEFFQKNSKHFPYFGGDTEKFALYCKNECYSRLFKAISKGNQRLPQIITFEIIEAVFPKLEKKEEKNDYPVFMYS